MIKKKLLKIEKLYNFHSAISKYSIQNKLALQINLDEDKFNLDEFCSTFFGFLRLTNQYQTAFRLKYQFNKTPSFYEILSTYQNDPQ